MGLDEVNGVQAVEGVNVMKLVTGPPKGLERVMGEKEQE